MASTTTRRNNTTQRTKEKERHKEEVEGGLHLGDVDGSRDAEKCSATTTLPVQSIYNENEKKKATDTPESKVTFAAFVCPLAFTFLLVNLCYSWCYILASLFFL